MQDSNPPAADRPATFRCKPSGAKRCATESVGVAENAEVIIWKSAAEPGSLPFASRPNGGCRRLPVVVPPPAGQGTVRPHPAGVIIARADGLGEESGSSPRERASLCGVPCPKAKASTNSARPTATAVRLQRCFFIVLLLSFEALVALRSPGHRLSPHRSCHPERSEGYSD